MFSTKEISTIDELISEAEKSDFHHDLELIQRAFKWANDKHTGQSRKSGQPYIIHPLTVAVYCVRLGLDTVSVAAALLHDTLEDTDSDINEIDENFGTEVAFIVDGLTNLKEYTSKFDNHDESQENFRKLMLKSTEDIRVIIIRLADKMHNIQTVEFLSPDRRYNFAKKIKLIYAPISEYIGLGYFHSVFMEESFKILEPEKYEIIDTGLHSLKLKSEGLLSELTHELSGMFSSYGLDVQSISTRIKNTQSVWMKLKNKVLKQGEELRPEHLEDLYDVLGIRIITKDIEDAYIALGLIQTNCDYFPESFDDYIVNPKPNGYQSIHLVIKYQEQQVEVQIRTAEMHHFNEFGPASHIAYKLSGSEAGDNSYTWTKELLDWRESEDGSSKYKIKAFANSIFVFTPKGRVIQLDKGASPIDFAFKIHTDLGFRYIGAIVNGKMVSMSHQLQTGDIVEILTSKKDNVNAGWLEFAKGNSSRNRIRKWLRTSQQLQNGRPK